MRSGSAIDPDILLAWYDRHARRLPWRALPGEQPDPYHVWLSEIMLQQTTVPAVKGYYETFLALWPRVQDLAAAPVEAVMAAWAGLGYYARARNLHACAKLVSAAHGGRFPDREDALRELPGIGAYTAAASAAIAFGRRAVVVDGNVERVVTRLHRLAEPLPGAKPVIRALTDAITPARRAGDFAQAMMDLGATICTPRNPACVLCPWQAPCAARAAGDQMLYPVKAAKRAVPVRRGAAFVAVRADGAVLVRRRPENGLLGGMLEVPGTDWRADAPLPKRPDGAPLAGEWRACLLPATHVFTHFRLELAVFRGAFGQGTAAPEGMRWLPASEIADAAFPTAMRKVLAVALE
jgi:A/G-specific adenine glycosylase